MTRGHSYLILLEICTFEGDVMRGLGRLGICLGLLAIGLAAIFLFYGPISLITGLAIVILAQIIAPFLIAECSS